MLSKNPDFKRIKIRAAGLAGTATYWLGPDHLLVVLQEAYSERYRRFYLRDIQAVIIRQTNGWIWISIALIVFTLLFGVLPLATGGAGARIWGGGFTVVGLIALGINLAAGPTCDCRLVTAVQKRGLPHLNRWKQATRLLAELQPEVNRVQRASSPAPAAAAAAEERPEPAQPEARSASNP